jgi:hypothetical protein
MPGATISSNEAAAACAPLLWFLLFLFCLRVLGQALVAAFEVPFLPPMNRWYSGVLPYPILLPVQILIIVLLAKVSTDFTRRRGFFVVPRRAMGRFLQWFSYLYWGGMAARYVMTMALHPERRWFGGTIPIFFHCVLATFSWWAATTRGRPFPLPRDDRARRRSHGLRAGHRVRSVRVSRAS